MAEARIATVTVKSDRPTIVARFWRELLGYEVAPNHSDSIMLAAGGLASGRKDFRLRLPSLSAE